MKYTLHMIVHISHSNFFYRSFRYITYNRVDVTLSIFRVTHCKIIFTNILPHSVVNFRYNFFRKINEHYQNKLSLPTFQNKKFCNMGRIHRLWIFSGHGKINKETEPSTETTNQKQSTEGMKVTKSSVKLTSRETSAENIGLESSPIQLITTDEVDRGTVLHFITRESYLLICLNGQDKA